MLRSINAWSVPGEADFEALFRDLSNAGFDAVEMNVDAEDASSRHALSLKTTRDELRSIRALSEKYRLPVCGISTSLWADRLGGERPVCDARELMEKQLCCAEALGADGVLVVPGGIGPDVSIQRAWDKAHETLEAMRDLVEGAGARVGLENVWNNFFISPFDMARFLDEANMKNLGAYFDVGNVAIFSYPEYWIDILASRIVKIHVKDFRKSGGNAGFFVNLLEGSIRWPRVMDALRRAGYDGSLTAELGAMPETPEYLYQITKSALDEIIKM